MAKISKEFDNWFGKVVFHYKGRAIPVEELGIDTKYLGSFCRAIMRDRNYVLDGITYDYIRSARYVGDKKAPVIAEALIKVGVDIPDMPDMSEKREPTRLIMVGPAAAECTNCGAILTTNMDAGQQLYKYCPMCGRKIMWEE